MVPASVQRLAGAREAAVKIKIPFPIRMDLCRLSSGEEADRANRLHLP